MNQFKPKLIEVALPLAAINAASAKEKTMGAAPHPQNIHRWWARRPLATTRAVIWASLVDDPSCDESLTIEEQEEERSRLFRILERLVVWKNSNDCEVLSEARAEIDRCFPDGPPPILDPFGGGGAIPLEAQRLGLEVFSGDLNPVAVLIQKAMIEIPPRFAGHIPVHPELDSTLSTWTGAQGLAKDVETYGRWMRDEAERRIGHLYPKATGPGGSRLKPIAWIWARTVESPDPSWKGHVPLVASWVVARAPSKPTMWVEPVIDRGEQSFSYEMREGGVTAQRTMGRGGGVCLATGATISLDYVQKEGQAGRIGHQLIAVVAAGPNGRVYCSPATADLEAPDPGDTPWVPTGVMSVHPQYMGSPRYGLDEWWKLFSPRQITALVTFSDLLPEVRSQVLADALDAGMSDNGPRLRDGGNGGTAYADAIVTYLAFAIDKCADHWSNVCGWHNSHSPQIRNVFARQAISMTWDYAEANPFSGKLASWDSMMRGLVGAISEFGRSCLNSGAAHVAQRDAQARVAELPDAVVSTDPPYYDSVPYSDISDFFYVWLRKNLADVWPDECATLLTPKSDELVADNQRFGGRTGAEEHFESGMSEFMKEVATSHHPDVPSTIYYAYKASESGGKTGWSTFLQAVLDAGLQVNATWPVRTELANRMRSLGANALASSIVLVCRARDLAAPLASRGEFIGALRDELPDAVRLLQSGNIAPVDIAQSTIGPGIKVFSRYTKVVEADGSTMSVASALGIINDVLGEVLDGEEAELDPDTRFAVTWYGQHGYNPGRSGDADSQARAKNTSLAGIESAGIGEARGGSFRLFERPDLEADWSPAGDSRLTVWEATQHLVAALDRSESEAAQLLGQLGGYGDRARQLAYLLFHKATDKGWAEEASAYNGLITAWPTLQAGAARPEKVDGQQRML